MALIVEPTRVPIFSIVEQVPVTFVTGQFQRVISQLLLELAKMLCDGFLAFSLEYLGYSSNKDLSLSVLERQLI